MQGAPTPLYIFLDVDGVLNAYSSPSHGKLCQKIVTRFNTLLEKLITMGYEPRIILNSSWNIRFRDEEELAGFKAELVEAGLVNIQCLKGRTRSAGGGGGNVRRWLVDNDALGSPFIILDELWCRLIWTRGREGFTEERFAEALAMVRRTITNEGERRAAIDHIVARCLEFRNNHWMSPYARKQAAEETMHILTHLITVDDFLAAACLKKSDTPKAPETKGILARLD